MAATLLYQYLNEGANKKEDREEPKIQRKLHLASGLRHPQRAQNFTFQPNHSSGHKTSKRILRWRSGQDRRLERV